MFLGPFVCLFVRAHKSKTVDWIDLKILHQLGSIRGSVLLEDDPDPELRLDTRNSGIFKKSHLLALGEISKIHISVISSPIRLQLEMGMSDNII